MPKFAANLTMMYTEHPFLDRFAAASKDGFKAVEFLFPYEFAAKDIEQRLKDNGLTQALFLGREQIRFLDLQRKPGKAGGRIVAAAGTGALPDVETEMVMVAA